jgi:hypothetical protein
MNSSTAELENPNFRGQGVKKAAYLIFAPHTALSVSAAVNACQPSPRCSCNINVSYDFLPSFLAGLVTKFPSLPPNVSPILNSHDSRIPVDSMKTSLTPKNFLNHAASWHLTILRQEVVNASSEAVELKSTPPALGVAFCTGAPPHDGPIPPTDTFASRSEPVWLSRLALSRLHKMRGTSQPPAKTQALAVPTVRYSTIQYIFAALQCTQSAEGQAQCV